ncbi:uncharacterized protein F4807DRAFT_112151 [Annulohypoxylon truncatum]|uniref:uncharacterized protein n=1 Tax=Annulohypoxylon truncatum TaxID=327061 RepID=UPI0020084E91|nr:uncharacterized protein F4807DRAFT_112151 [Annulohypoxylon truncatum]KAI1214042.1 hypothetical protein F4807DRAFT_112151 [Annulohypoxylon truncatum]
MPTLAFMYMGSIIAWSYEVLVCGVLAIDEVFKMLFILQRPFFAADYGTCAGRRVVWRKHEMQWKHHIPLYYPSFDLGDVYHCNSQSRSNILYSGRGTLSRPVPIFSVPLHPKTDDSRVICEIVQGI